MLLNLYWKYCTEWKLKTQQFFQLPDFIKISDYLRNTNKHLLSIEEFTIISTGLMGKCLILYFELRVKKYINYVNFYGFYRLIKFSNI